MFVRPQRYVGTNLAYSSLLTQLTSVVPESLSVSSYESEFSFQPALKFPERAGAGLEMCHHGFLTIFKYFIY